MKVDPVTAADPGIARAAPEAKDAAPRSGWSARAANIVLTAQVQLAYACAMDARGRAQRATAVIEQSWPRTPVRELVLDIYRAQMQSADVLARNVIAGARQRCGLAYARF